MAVLHVGLEELQDVIAKEERIVLVDFWGPWCAPCRTMKPHIDRLSEERASDTCVVAVNVDATPEVVQHYDVRGVPTLMLFRSGELVRRFTGAMVPSQIVAELDALTAA